MKNSFTRPCRQRRQNFFQNNFFDSAGSDQPDFETFR